jgi:Tfp pilus assembly protein PilE
MMRKIPGDIKKNGIISCGYSLVEVLVASIVLVIAIVAVAAIVKSGRQIDIVDKHRRQARAVIMSYFERKEYSYSYYQQLNPMDADPLTLSPITGISLDDNNSAIQGTLYITISKENTDMTDMPYHEVTMRMDWVEYPEGINESITLVKRISEANF